MHAWQHACMHVWTGVCVCTHAHGNEVCASMHVCVQPLAAVSNCEAAAAVHGAITWCRLVKQCLTKSNSPTGGHDGCLLCPMACFCAVLQGRASVRATSGVCVCTVGALPSSLLCVACGSLCGPCRLACSSSGVPFGGCVVEAQLERVAVCVCPVLTLGMIVAVAGGHSWVLGHCLWCLRGFNPCHHHASKALRCITWGVVASSLPCLHVVQCNQAHHMLCAFWWLLCELSVCLSLSNSVLLCARVVYCIIGCEEQMPHSRVVLQSVTVEYIGAWPGWLETTLSVQLGLQSWH